MIKQNIFIINYNSLYEILNEIKDNLSFNVENYESEDDLIENSSLDIKNSLIISRSKNKLLSDKKIDNKNFLDLSLFPISLNKLVELINIQLIKQKYNYQSKISVNRYELDLNSRIISTQKNELKLTEREIDIILFLNDKNIPKSVNDLQSEVWGYSFKQQDNENYNPFHT